MALSNKNNPGTSGLMNLFDPSRKKVSSFRCMHSFSLFFFISVYRRILFSFTFLDYMSGEGGRVALK